MIGLDDAHWADDGLLDLIEEVTLGLEEALLVLCTSRPELVERRPGSGSTAPNVTRIDLRLLSYAATAELATALLPEDARAGTEGGCDLRRQPVLRGGGELRIIDDPEARGGALRRRSRRRSRRGSTLRPTEKRAIQYAAVLGSISPRPWIELLGEPVDEVLATLAAKALIQGASRRVGVAMPSATS